VSGILAKARGAEIKYPLTMSNKELGSILYPPVQKEARMNAPEIEQPLQRRR